MLGRFFFSRGGMCFVLFKVNLFILNLYLFFFIRLDIFKIEFLLFKLDVVLSGVGFFGCFKGFFLLGRSRRGKIRYRKVSVKGSCGDLFGFRVVVLIYEFGGLGSLGGLGGGFLVWEVCFLVFRGFYYDFLLRKMFLLFLDLLLVVLGVRVRGVIGGVGDFGLLFLVRGDIFLSEGLAFGFISLDLFGGVKGEFFLLVGFSDGVGFLGIGREGIAGRGGSRVGF